MGGLIRRGRYYFFKFRHNIVFISSKYKIVTVNWNVSLSNTDQMSNRSQSPVSSKVLRISSDIDIFLFSGFEPPSRPPQLAHNAKKECTALPTIVGDSKISILHIKYQRCFLEIFSSLGEG